MRFLSSRRQRSWAHSWRRGSHNRFDQLGGTGRTAARDYSLFQLARVGNPDCMAERAREVERPQTFDGLLRESVQRKVDPFLERSGTGDAFPAAYVSENIRFFRTATNTHEHDEVRQRLMDDGEIWPT